jgi:hypothetical protein
MVAEEGAITTEGNVNTVTEETAVFEETHPAVLVPVTE